MFCTKCGNELFEGGLFCTKCGQPVNVPSAATPNPSSSVPTNATSNLPTPVVYAPSPPWGNVLILQKGESVSTYWYADHEVGQLAIVNGRRQTVKQRFKGYLILTTQRLIFVKERGIFGKSYHIDMTFQFDNLAGLSMGGLVMKYVSISDSSGENILHVRGVGNEVEFANFKALIQDQANTRQQAIEEAKRRDRIQITLDFGFLRDYMSKGGLSIQAVKCPQCGAPISLPKQGNETICEHCGTTVFAQDIMEKVKQLIG